MMTAQEASAIDMMALAGAFRTLVADWDLDWRECRALLPSYREDMRPPTPDGERRMRMLVEIGHRLGFEDVEEKRDWLREPSPFWLWRTPLEVMGGTVADLRCFRDHVERGRGS